MMTGGREGGGREVNSARGDRRTMQRMRRTKRVACHGR